MKVKKVTKNDPLERLAVSVRRSTLENLERYRQFYKNSYHEEIERSHLVEEMLKEFMLADRDFQKASIKNVNQNKKVEDTKNTPAVAGVETGDNALF